MLDTLTPIQITEYRTKLIQLFPYVSITTNPTTGFTDIEIENVIPFAWDLIAVECVKKRDIILAYTTIHLLLKYRKDATDFINSETEIEESFKRVEVGDINFDIASSDNNTVVTPSFWKSSKYGERAYYLIFMCAKARIGVIV